MADISEIISEIKMNESSGNTTINYNEILKKLKTATTNKADLPLLIKTMKPDLLHTKEIQCYTPAQILLDYVTTSLFEGTHTRKYFELFLTKFKMGETDKIEYNLSVILYILENDKEDVLLDLIASKTSKTELIRALKTNYQNVPLEMCFKFVHFRLLPQIFSKFVDMKDKYEIIDFIMLLPMGFSSEFMSADEKTQLKDDIMKVYLPAIRPENNISKWWNYCKVLIHYSGKLLHTEIELTNAILRRVEYGFKAKIIESRAGSYECWKVLIENYNLDPKYLRSSKQISLLIKPLKAKLSKNSIVSIKRFDAFACFIEYLENYSVPCLQEFLSFSFGPFDENYKKPSDITNNQYFPGRLTQEIYPYTTEILLKLLGHDMKNCCCNIETTYLTDVYKIKPFLCGSNIKEHCQIFFSSVRICSLLIVEWTQGNNRKILTNCLWDTLFSIVKNCPDASGLVFSNILTNIKLIMHTCLHYDSYYDILNVILKSVTKYIKTINYNEEICKDFIYPLVYELCICQIKKPKSIDCNVTPLFNYCKEGIDFYKAVKSHFINKFPKCDLTEKLLKSIVMNISNSKADMETKDIINELLIWFLDNDSTECYNVWKIAADGQIFSNFPELKDNLLKAIKPKTLMEKAMENTNVLQLLGVFVNFISKGDKHFLNDIIITIRYSLKSLTKQEINDHISILKSLIDIKVKYKFESNRDFCILFVDLLKHEVYSVLMTIKHYVLNLSSFERNELSKILHGVISGLTNVSDKKVCSEIADILKILDVVEPSIISRGAKIRNMATTKVMPCGSPRSNLMQLFNETPETIFGSMLNKSPRSSKFSIPNSSPILSKNNVDLNELSDADFVRIDAEVFVDKNMMSEHQKEVASKRRDDIPALYEDLTISSNDGFQSNPEKADIQNENSKTNTIENDSNNGNSVRKTRKCQAENRSDDKSDLNSSSDNSKRKRKRDSGDSSENKNKSVDSVENDTEISNGVKRFEDANEQNGNDVTEPKNKRRRSDSKPNDLLQTRRKHKESIEGNQSKSESTTPISNRTKRMLESPMNTLKLSDKLHNSTSPITIMFKVPLNKSSTGVELSGVKNIATDVSETINGSEEEKSNKEEEKEKKDKDKIDAKVNNKKVDSPIKKDNKSKLSTNKKDESLDVIDDDTNEVEVKTNSIKKVDSPTKKDNKFSKLSTNKRDESLDTDDNDIIEVEVKTSSIKKDSPTKKELIFIDEPVVNTSNVQSEHMHLESQVDNKKQETLDSSPTKIIQSSTDNNDVQTISANETELNNQITKPTMIEDAKLEQNESTKMSKDIQLKNSEDIIPVSTKQDDNKGAEKDSVINKNNDSLNKPNNIESPTFADASENESPKMNPLDAETTPAKKKGRRARKDDTVTRALSILKMNIVGGNDFQNLPRKRNATTKVVPGAIPTPDRKRRSDINGPRTRTRGISPRNESVEEDSLEKNNIKRKIDSIDNAVQTADGKKSKLTDSPGAKPASKQLKLDEIIGNKSKNSLNTSDSIETDTEEKKIDTNELQDEKSNESEVKKHADQQEKNIDKMDTNNKHVSKQGKESYEHKSKAKNKPANKLGKEPNPNEDEMKLNDQTDISNNQSKSPNKKQESLNEKTTNSKSDSATNIELVPESDDINAKLKSTDVEIRKNENKLNDKKSPSKISTLEDNIDDKKDLSKDAENRVRINTRSKAGVKITDESDINITIEQPKSNIITEKNQISKQEVEAKNEQTTNTRKSITRAAKISPKNIIEDSKNKTVTNSNESLSLAKEDKNTLEDNELEKKESPNVIESSPDDNNLSCASPLMSESQRINQTSPIPKLHEVRVALFRNNFDKLSPEKINKLSHLNEISPVKDTETMEVISQGNTSIKVSEMDTETMNTTSDLSDVSLNLAIEKTPERSVNGDTLISSPISYDTPTRNKELMKSTLDISPIKIATDKKTLGKISPDIFSSQNGDTEIKQDSLDISSTKNDDVNDLKSNIVVLKGPSSRSAKLLNLLPQALPIKTHKVILDSVPRAPQVSSPTTERIKRMMLNCEEQNQVEIGSDLIEEDVLRFNGKDIFKFEKEVPSPLATPKVSILKRKSEAVEDGFSGSPCAKRKRVNFSDPPTTSEKIYFKEIEKKSHFKKVKKKSLKKLQYKIYHPTNNENEHELNKNSDELDDIKPLDEAIETDVNQVFQFVGKTDLEDTEVIVPQPSKEVNILSNLLIKESPKKTKEKATIKNYNNEMLKMAKNMFSLIKETTSPEEYTELISDFIMESLSVEHCIKVSTQLLKLIKDRTPETEYSQLITGIVKENCLNESTKCSVQLLENDVEIIPVDENEATVNLIE